MLRMLQHSFGIALEAIARNKMRSFLTSLGIIFGVASVITMLAIGKGTEQKIVEELKALGTNNIIIRAVTKEKDPQAGEESEDSDTPEPFTPGLNLKDAESIRSLIPGIASVTEETDMPAEMLNNGVRKNVNLSGISEEYMNLGQLKLAEGSFFNETQFGEALLVCIIGNSLRSRFFPKESPLGKTIKVGKNWLRIIGIAEERSAAGLDNESLHLRDFNLDVYIPIRTLLLRYQDRSRDALKEPERDNFFGEDENTAQQKNYNRHQLDRIIVQVHATEDMPEISDVIHSLLMRRHNQVEDFAVDVPAQLLEQKEKTNDLFAWVLIAIACISLLVGGIGIMNIMLASVLERTREIGLRQAVGATQQAITLQFLSEAASLSIGGGITGIITGVGLCYLIDLLTGIPTIITPVSVCISFAVSVSVGLIFGYYPARKAALQDPVTSLRYE